jgi:hypothetical protein
MDKPNYVGERYGRLVVIASTESKHNRSRWICQCDCGNRCVATGASLRSDKKRSCGCLRREVSAERARLNSLNNTLPEGEASFNLLYSTYRWQAEKRKLEFNLSKQDFRELTSGNCFYCGLAPVQEYFGSSCNGVYLYNGVDRQDNNVGYTLTNCAPCCKTCNDMKRTRTVEEFLKACESVVVHQTLRSKQK